MKAQPADQVSHLPPTNEIKQRVMREVKFEDLTVELGKPYVYMHMGDCEHEIKFIDIRFVRLLLERLRACLLVFQDWTRYNT